MSPCTVCGEKWPSTVKSMIENGEVVDLGCDRCLGLQPRVPDVYFRRPYHSEVLDVDFTSRSQKAQYLKDHDLSEAGDREMSEIPWVEGTRSFRHAQFEKEKPMLRKIYRDWRERAEH